MPGQRGNSGGKKGRSGRKTKAEEMGLVVLLDECWTVEARKRTLQKLAEDCEAEDFQVRNESRKLLMSYTFGKPTEKHEHGGEDGGPVILKVVYDVPK